MSKKVAEYQRLKQVFKSKTDPWHFQISLYEQERFKQLIELCKQVPHKRVLEIGCAEGFFTKFLLKISKDVTAIDVSEIAIERAKKYAPRAHYLVKTIEELDAKQQFDLIVASEVLYYSPEQLKVIKKLKKLGKYLVTSNFLFNHWRGYKSEFYLSSLKSLRRFIRFSFSERKMTAFGLWLLVSQFF